MKHNVLKATLTASAILIASAYTLSAQAHCFGTNGNFGASSIVASGINANQYDTYVMVCPAGTTGVNGRINKGSEGAGGNGFDPIRLRIAKGGYASTSSQDTSQTAGAACNPLDPDVVNAGGVAVSTVAGGPGQYTVVVSKGSNSSINYAAEVHCVGNDNPDAQSVIDPAPPVFTGAAGDRTGEFDRVINN